MPVASEMNGQLSEHPPGELIREIAAKSLAGKLQLEHDRIKVVIYFEKSDLIYAASNLRTLRLREYLLKGGLNEAALARYDERRPDLELVKALSADHLISTAKAEEVQTKQVTDILRVVLSWTDGAWDFDPRARLDEQTKLNVDLPALLLEAGRRTPPKFAASRFRVPDELISPVATALSYDKLLPTEGFVLSRLERAAPLQDLLAVSGVSESDAFVIIYSLALAGLVERQHWSFVLASQTADAVRHKAIELIQPVLKILVSAKVVVRVVVGLKVATRVGQEHVE